ncbi:hypothetical protein BLNAU_19121 [Blattamonas nauphoetae]|uniref:Uncharacterized protein n=1 Tax=Blattamonas nauphoetae TaxID=2049346 RepID=A0ABQ9X2G7_9EUKA|nr:hypothetical protein BLNAU_19121 [Blattamonas nauphoetae]
MLCPPLVSRIGERPFKRELHFFQSHRGRSFCDVETHTWRQTSVIGRVNPFRFSPLLPFDPRHGKRVVAALSTRRSPSRFPLHPHAACSATRSDAQTATGEVSVEMVVVCGDHVPKNRRRREQMRRVQQCHRFNQKARQLCQIGQPHVHRDPPRAPRTSQLWQMRQAIKDKSTKLEFGRDRKKCRGSSEIPFPASDSVSGFRNCDKRGQRGQQVRRNELTLQSTENVTGICR